MSRLTMVAAGLIVLATITAALRTDRPTTGPIVLTIAAAPAPLTRSPSAALPPVSPPPTFEPPGEPLAPAAEADAPSRRATEPLAPPVVDLPPIVELPPGESEPVAADPLDAGPVLDPPWLAPEPAPRPPTPPSEPVEPIELRAPVAPAEPPSIGVSPPADEPLSSPAATPLVWAGGAATAWVPAGWSAHELGVGRTWRVLLAPAGAGPPRWPLVDGVWLAHHAAPATTADHAAELRTMTPRRLAEAVVGAVATSAAEPVVRGDATRCELPFEAPADMSAQLPARRGRHLLLRDAWGVIEVHGQWPAEFDVQRQAAWETIVAGLALSPPQPPPALIASGDHPAATILGTWKSLHSRLRLLADGRMELLLDAPTPRSLAGDAPPAAIHRQGRYEARNDRLSIRWDDGSEQLIRWRLDGGLLYVVDGENCHNCLARLIE